MSKNLNKIILLSIFFIIVSGFFFIINEKVYHQKIILNHIDDFEANKLFQLKNKQGVILDISEKNLRTNLFSRMNLKIMFSNILRSLQSNKVHRYEFKNYKNYTDEEFKYLQKILNNIELEGAYFLNPDQLSDTIINIYANDLKKANEVFNEFYIFCALNIVREHLEESSRISSYRDKLFQSFFEKYSSEKRLNNYMIAVASFIENEKNFTKSIEFSSIRLPVRIINQFIELKKNIIEYLSIPSKSNHEKLILNYKNLAADQEVLKVKKDTIEILSKIKINTENLFVQRRVDSIKLIEEFNSLLSSNEMIFFNVLKDDLIKDTSFRLNILSDQQIYKKYNLKKIEDTQLRNEMFEGIKENYYIKDIYNNLLLTDHQIVLKNNLKNQKIYENMNINEEVLSSYLLNKMTIVVEKLNIAYFLSLVLFSIVSSVVIIGVSHSFKKNI